MCMQYVHNRFVDFAVIQWPARLHFCHSFFFCIVRFLATVLRVKNILVSLFDCTFFSSLLHSEYESNYFNCKNAWFYCKLHQIFADSNTKSQILKITEKKIVFWNKNIVTESVKKITANQYNFMKMTSALNAFVWCSQMKIN